MADIRKQKRTSRLSVVISTILHGGIVIALLVFAAREGMLGKQLKKITVSMVPKEKPPEKPKEKPPEPKPEIVPPKVEAPRPVPQLPARTQAAPPPASVAPVAAPPAAAVPAFDFEGGKTVETSSDPSVIYKGYVEYTLRSHWNRPDGVADAGYVAEVEVGVDSEGRIASTEWKRGSGDNAWDASVRKALEQTTSLDRHPPKGFPSTVLVRFDVQVGDETPVP